MVRFIDDLGRIVLPAEMRTTLDWTVKTPIEILCSQEKEKITLTKHHSSCVFCGGVEDLKEYQQKWVCGKCLMKLVNL